MLSCGFDSLSLASACGRRRATVRRWLGMEAAKLPADEAALIAKALHIRVWWLITGEGAIESTRIRRPRAEPREYQL
jgi:hypothetical protein